MSPERLLWLRGTRLHVHVFVAEILIRELDGVAIDRELSRHVRRAGLQTDFASQCGLAVEKIEAVVLRKDAGADVQGDLYLVAPVA